ncbi:hypothetical protein [Streptomyces sp. NPDC058653]|uniref:hypothetical protein n=1 Tax=Streptomyces sp. NPDC058653 TaxID=3346576 RepID=UPI0036479F66
MTDRVLRLLRTRPDLAAIAAFVFNFDVARTHHVEEVHLASGASLEPIAGDDTGGTYFLCGGAAVLYASSEGDAVLVGDSVTDAVEALVRLPWYCEDLSGDLDEERIRAAVDAADEEAREEFAPELHSQRAALLTGLGLPDRPLTELLAMRESAAARTEPDHLLLNSHELLAYQLTDSASRRPPLSDIVLGPGRDALARFRAGEPGMPEKVVADAVLRAGVIRAAQYDRQDGDLPLLRLLLERETAERSEWFAERGIAAMLVALRGQEEDLPLVRAATDGRAVGGRGAPDWARTVDAERHGRDPATESPFTWIELARRQGRTEHARVALIRLLDDTGPDADRLGALSEALERIGDHAQAARAQSCYLSLQNTDWDRAGSAYALARLERRKGDLDAARRALERSRTAVTGSGRDETVAQWHRRGLGRMITEQHLELVLAAAEAGDSTLARETMTHAEVLLSTIAKQSAKALSELSTRAKWAVAALDGRQG